METDEQSVSPTDSPAWQPSTIIETGGELLNTALVDLIRDHSGELKLSVWQDGKEKVGAAFPYGDTLFRPPSANGSLLNALILPAESSPHTSTPELLSTLCRVIGESTDLADRALRLLGRFVLATWLVEAFRIAPCLAIDGPQAGRVLDILQPVCRHPLLLTAVAPAGLRTLPSRIRFTLMISQNTISDGLWNLLDDASCCGRQILYRGELLDLYGSQIIRADSFIGGSRARFLDLSTLPAEKELRVIGPEAQKHIAAEFQPKLLAFRRANIRKALTHRYDASAFDPSLRELVRMLAAVTPDDPDLLAELPGLLHEQNEAVKSSKWIDIKAAVVGSVQVACHGGDGMVYVGQLAETAQEILLRRGGDRQIDAGEIGRTLKALGFTTEPRDARGVRLRITPQVCERARQLARDLGLTSLDKDGSDATERWQESKPPGKATAGAGV